MTIDSKELELDVLAGCLNSTTRTRRVAEVLDGYRFADRPSQWVWRSIKTSYSEHASAPRVKLLAFKAQNEVKNDDLFDEIIELLRTLKKHPSPTDLDAILPEIISAYNQQRILETVDSLIDAAEHGDIGKAQEVLATGANAVNRRANRSGSTGVATIARRALSEPVNKNFIPTGLSWVDRRIRGIAKGQVFLQSGITGIGKSVSMIQAGQAAMGAGKRVLHFTTEMDTDSVTYRYLSRFTGIPEQRIRERRMSVDEHALLGAWLDRNENRMNDLLKIEQVIPNAGTIVDIQAGLDELDRDGYRADLVIIDSPDHLRSLRKHNNARDENTEVWWGIKAIADRGYALWATTQIARGKWEFKLATPEAVAENYNISRIADAFFSVNWCIDKQGKTTGKRRLYWGKYRTGSARHVIPLKCDLARMIMITEAEPEEMDSTPVKH